MIERERERHVGGEEGGQETGRGRGTAREREVSKKHSEGGR